MKKYFTCLLICYCFLINGQKIDYTEMLKPHMHYTYIAPDGNIKCTDNHAEVLENSRITEGKAITLTSISPANRDKAAKKTTVSSTQGATISLVSTEGIEPDVLTAINYAFSLWGSFVKSTVPIKVKFNWQTLGTNVLGSAGSYNGVSQAGGVFEIIPMPIFNAKTGVDKNNNTEEIVANFNSALPNWYFGTDRQTPVGKVDFVSTVLHELGHGMGFSGSVSANSANAPCTGVVGEACMGFVLTFTNGTSLALPLTFDKLMVNGTGDNLNNTTLFPNPSTNLFAAITNNSLFFNGTKAKAQYGLTLPTARKMAGPTPVPMYAPTTYRQGSTYSHFNESTFPSGNNNALMTFQLVGNEAVHTIGPVGCGLMEDIGWQLETGCSSLLAGTLAVELLSFNTQFYNKQVMLNWETSSETNNSHFEIEKSKNGNQFEKIGIIQGNKTTKELSKYSFEDKNLQNGLAYYRLKQIDFDGTYTYSKILAQSINLDEIATMYPVPTTGILKVKSNNNIDKINIFNAKGIKIASNLKTNAEMDIAHLQSGIYTVELISNGKSTFQKVVKK